MPVSSRVMRPPRLWGDGRHDDHAAILWRIANWPRWGSIYLPLGLYLVAASGSVLVRPPPLPSMDDPAWQRGSVSGYRYQSMTSRFHDGDAPPSFRYFD